LKQNSKRGAVKALGGNCGEQQCNSNETQVLTKPADTRVSPHGLAWMCRPLRTTSGIFAPVPTESKEPEELEYNMQTHNRGRGYSRGHTGTHKRQERRELRMDAWKQQQYDTPPTQ